jgi:DNA-binding response OmpR family regulator
MKILIIENDEKVERKLKRVITKKRNEVFSVADGESGLDEALSGIYDAVVIDTELGGCTGLDVLKRIRKSGLSVPVLMLSPKCSVSEKVRGLESGADDFMERPFADEEFMARLNAITRRRGEFILDNLLRFSKLSLDMGTYELTHGDDSVRLSNKEFEIMKYFFLNGHNIVSKEELLSRLWGLENSTADNNLEVYISYLRRKLIRIGSDIRIFCVKNVGYRLLDPQLERACI